MINLLSNLVDRALERAPVLQRRQPSLFEPAQDAVLTRRLADGGDSGGADVMLTKSETPVSQAPVNNIINSRSQRSNETATVIPRMIDVTAGEANPKPQSSYPNQTAFTNRQDSDVRADLTVREVTKPESKRPGTPEYQPSIETIVETKLASEVGVQTPTGKDFLEETSHLAQPDVNSQSTENNLIGRRPDDRKKPPKQVDVAALVKRPEQRRIARQETQRAMRAQLQPERPDLPPPVMPTINVTIGRVEVRATAPAKRAEPARQSRPKLSLEDYLRGRGKGN